MIEIINNFQLGISIMLQPGTMVLMVLGVAIGLVGGALPGITGSITMALLLPFTFKLSPAQAMMLLVSVWTGSQYGNSITAILIRTPGTASAVMTVIDGYALHQQGKSGKALGVSLIAGFVGGLLTTLFLIVVVVPLGEFALTFGPAEYFSVTIFGLAAVSGLGQHDILKTLISCTLGLFLSTIGMDLFSGAQRFTFGVTDLVDGIDIVPALVGLFAISEVMLQAEKLQQWEYIKGKYSTKLPSWKELRSVNKATMIGTAVAMVVGPMPAAGSTVAAVVAYSEAKRWSKHPELFGKGSLEGVAAPESANNACIAGDLVPLLAIGVPGSVPAAMMMAALLVHGLWPGPMLFEKSPDVVYGLFCGTIAANFIMLGLGLIFLKPCIAIVNVRLPYLLASILGLVMIGCYAIENSVFPIIVILIFGVIGYIMRRYGFSHVAMILGMVLGPISEASFRQALVVYDGNLFIFFTRPFSLILLLLALASFLYPFIAQYLQAKKKAKSTLSTSEKTATNYKEG